MNRRLLLVTAVLVCSVCSFVCSFAQTSPNLENGFKNYGSYDGSHLDTVNLMNGNVMLHVPVLPAYPQRGNFAPQYSLYMSSKAWQVHSKLQASPGVGTLTVFWWQSNAPGVMVISNTGMLVRRSLLKTFAGNAQTFYNTQGYSLTGPDAAVHKFNPVPGALLAPNSDPTVYESVDSSGYHIVISNADSNGVMSTVTVIDRSGIQYQGTFSSDYSDFSTRCGRPGIFGLPSVGPYAPLAEDIPFGDQVCPQFAFSQTATDSNGNQISFRSTGPQTPPVPSSDTLARNMPFSFTPATPGVADSSKCVIRSGQPFAGADLVYYNAPDGTIRSMQRCYAAFPIQTAFGLTAYNGVNTVNVAEAPNSLGGLGTATLLVTLIQADGTKWTFDYDSYANLTYVGLPTGGSIGYTWTTITLPACSGELTSAGRAVKYRTFTDNNGNSSQWTYNWGAPGTTLTNTVTDPAGNDTVHVFTALDGGCSFYETTTKYFQGPQSGQPLKQVETAYSPNAILTDDLKLGNVVPISIKTTVNPSGKVNLVTKQYDSGAGAGSPIFGNVIKEQEFDWGQGSPGPLLRETDTTYQWQVDSRYQTAHLIDLPASVVVKDGSGCALSETDYSYDEAQYFTTTTIGTQHVAAPNPAPIRGNLTTVTHWAAPTTSCNPKSGTAVSSHTNWYDTGEPFQKIDPLGHTTTLSYDLAYVGAYVTQTCSPQTGTVTHCVSGTYDFNTGVLTSLTHENASTQASGNTPGDDAHTSRFTYDYMFHIASAQAPPDPANGGARASTSFSYSTMTTPGVFPVTITRQRSITTALTDSATNTFDGLARPIIGQHTMPSGPPSTVTTVYDDLHSKVTISNPFFTTADATYGTTSTQSDALGRAQTVTEQDGSVKTLNYDVAAASSMGNCNDSADEAGNKRRSCSDALGRLVEVDEPNPAAPATYAQASITINGNEQTNPLPATSGTGSVTISGSEGTSQVCTDPLPPKLPVCHTIPDSGTIGIQVGTYPVLYVTYGSGSTGATLALALQQGFHNDASSPVDAAIDPNNSAKINFTARAVGQATNYALTYFNGTDFTVGGLAALSGGRDASSNPDTGTITVTLNGTPYSTTYNGSDTGATIAARLASAISAGPFANATAPGNVITLAAKNTGQGGDYPFSTAYTYDTAHFGGPSFTPSPANNSMANGYSVGDIGNQSFVTLYQYDALANLLCVEQHGNVAPGTPGATGCSSAPNNDATSPWRVRRFTYDSLGRLLTTHNPESGTITYSYDLDGNLLQKASPAPNQTGTATQTISYCYDELHRVTGRAYSAQSCQGMQLPTGTAVVSYVYDSGDNAKGKLTSLADQAGTASYSYDVLGRLTGETRVISGVSKSLSYTYNLDGSMKSLTYPSGATVTYTPDSAGRMLSVVDAGNGINYVTGATYGPDGAITGFVSGNTGTSAGITNLFTYNKRLQPVNMSASAPGQTVFSIGYDFHVGNGASGSGSDNGSVWGITNYKDNTRNQAFTYDALNRLTSAQNAGTDCTQVVLGNNKKFWGNTYTYDAWGNLTNKTKITTACAGENLSVAALVNNQLAGYSYDAAGNMTHDATSGLNYTYDQENRITGAGGYTYTYDGDGNRVKKQSGSTGTLYWSMTPGIIGESDLAGVMKSEYVFFGGERVARKDSPGNAVLYYFSDHLKTASVITDSAGVIKAESDYYPWGGELQFVAGDSNHYKFTGKERDSESGLDYFGARYYSNGLGRFISADWSVAPEPVPYAEFTNPQTLNLYRYPSNPETYADSDGHESTDTARRRAVRQAWKQEQARVASGKPGTVRWTAAQRAELLERARVTGYNGHHINNVKHHPELAGDPNNIKFTKEHLSEHRGNWHNETTGTLFNRVFVAVQVIGAFVQAWGDYKFNQHESQTGLHSDALFGLRISNVDKAAQTLEPGAQFRTPGGDTFTLGKDHVWKNSYGDTIYYDPKDDKNHIKRNGCHCS